MKSNDRTPGYYLFLLLRNRWFLVRTILVVMIPTVVITYLLPKQYTVTTVLMPPDIQSTPGISIGGLAAGEFAGLFSGGMGYSLPLMTTLSDVYMEILNSRTLVEQVILGTAYIDSMDLREEYDRNEQVGLYWARKQFRQHYSAETTPSGFLRVEMTTGAPWYSVDVSERVVSVLDSLNRHVIVERASSARIFLEEQTASAESLLTSSSEALQQFEEEHGIVALDSELREFMRVLADLKQRYLSLSATARAMRQGLVYGSTSSLEQLEREVSVLGGMITSLEEGSTPAEVNVRFPFSLAELPELEFRYARLKSEYDTALRLTSLLRVNLEQAKVEEAVTATTIRVLDPPSHPGWKSKPRKLYIWIEVFALTLIVLITFLLLRERAHAMRTENPEAWRRWSGLMSEIRSELTFWRRKSTRDH